MENAKLKIAKNVFDMTVSTLERENLNFLKDADKMSIRMRIETDDLPVIISVETDAERQAIRIMAGYSITFPKERRIDGAIATCATNCNLVAGGFDFDYETGSVAFRISSSFAGSVVSPDAFMYLFRHAYNTCARYDAKLDKLAKGELPLAAYLYMFEDD